MLALHELIKRYMDWEDRRKWLFLRRLVYEQFRDEFFSSPQKIDELSSESFKKYYLSFCTIVVDNFVHKLTSKTFFNFFKKYSISELEELTRNDRIKIIGNVSWTQFHMGFKLGKWDDIKKGIKYLLFGDNEEPISEVDEYTVVERLRRVLEGNLAVRGFSRAKITSLLLICDKRDRFGMWNTVSNDELEKLGLKPKSDITRRRKVSDYLQTNRALNELKTKYGFENLADVDQFLWYALSVFQPPKEAIKVKEAPPKILGPLLESARENLELAEEYIKQDRAVLWGQTIALSFDAVMEALQRKIIDMKGIKVIEQLRKNKKLYLDILIGILQKDGLSIKTDDLELLKDLRNKVVHERHRPSKQNALWAFNVARSFIMKMYTEVFKS